MYLIAAWQKQNLKGNPNLGINSFEWKEINQRNRTAKVWEKNWAQNNLQFCQWIMADNSPFRCVKKYITNFCFSFSFTFGALYITGPLESWHLNHFVCMNRWESCPPLRITEKLQIQPMCKYWMSKWYTCHFPYCWSLEPANVVQFGLFFIFCYPCF